ncbi:MAG: hypothetical protein K2K37_12180 [Muribaculaceae bacterium]|nr:hypothetical protein [Muribaculaceae bacterium]
MKNTHTKVIIIFNLAIKLLNKYAQINIFLQIKEYLALKEYKKRAMMIIIARFLGYVSD